MCISLLTHILGTIYEKKKKRCLSVALKPLVRGSKKTSREIASNQLCGKKIKNIISIEIQTSI